MNLCLWLTDVAPGRTASAAFGLRAALREVLDAASAPDSRGCLALVTRWVNGEKPLRLTAAYEPETIERAIAAGNASGAGSAEFASAPLGETPPAKTTESPSEAPSGPSEPLPASDDWTPPYEAAKLALTLLSQSEGNPQVAYMWARINAVHLPRVYNDVARTLEAAFPVLNSPKR